jgi:hypothetical protein
MPSFKKKARQKERWVRLNPQGREVISNYVNSPYSLPTKVTWNENIKRWANNCLLSPVGLSSKTTRKTIESWLVFYYPQNTLLIMQSQGHTSNVSFDHYLNMPFDEKDRMEMKEFVDGWIYKEEN